MISSGQKGVVVDHVLKQLVPFGKKEKKKSDQLSLNSVFPLPAVELSDGLNSDRPTSLEQELDEYGTKENSADVHYLQSSQSGTYQISSLSASKQLLARQGSLRRSYTSGTRDGINVSREQAIALVIEGSQEHKLSKGEDKLQRGNWALKTSGSGQVPSENDKEYFLQIGNKQRSNTKISFTNTEKLQENLPNVETELFLSEEKAFICVTCGQEVLNDRVTIIKQYWHRLCFLCSHCNCAIDTNNFRIKKGKVLCNECRD